MDAREGKAIARIHDHFARSGYRRLTEQVNKYGMPAFLPQFLSEQGVRQEGLSVLDLGCGPGNLRDYTDFAEYRGVDLSPEMLREAGETGYRELIEAPMQEYAASPIARTANAVICLSCSYFLSPEEIGPFVENMDRLARTFWLISFDGVTDIVRHVYAAEDGIKTYNHIGTELPWSDCVRTTVRGWRSARSEEDIPMEIVLRVK